MTAATQLKQTYAEYLAEEDKEHSLLSAASARELGNDLRVRPRLVFEFNKYRTQSGS